MLSSCVVAGFKNNLGELWSLLSFILPGIFNDYQLFTEWFNRPFEVETSDEEEEENEEEGDEGEAEEACGRQRQVANSHTQCSQGSQGCETDVSSGGRTHPDGCARDEREYVGDAKIVNHKNVMTTKKRKKRRQPKALRKMSAKGPSVAPSSLLTEEETNIIVSSLHRVIRPFVLRRMKKDVLISIPSRVSSSLPPFHPSFPLSSTTYSIIASNRYSLVASCVTLTDLISLPANYYVADFFDEIIHVAVNCHVTVNRCGSSLLIHTITDRSREKWSVPCRACRDKSTSPSAQPWSRQTQVALALALALGGTRTHLQAVSVRMRTLRESSQRTHSRTSAAVLIQF